MTQPLPYEVLGHGWFRWGPVFFDRDLPSRFETEDDVKDTLGDGRLLVTLANGQRIIVRALSEDRKSARAEARRARLRGVE